MRDRLRWDGKWPRNDVTPFASYQLAFRQHTSFAQGNRDTPTHNLCFMKVWGCWGARVLHAQVVRMTAQRTPPHWCTGKMSGPSRMLEECY